MSEQGKETKNLTRYKLAAGTGTLLMAIGSFMACLSLDPIAANVGNGLLIVSIAVMFYGYTTWQP
ncbi:MAG: hypothetical protein HFF18_03895 [Oscillospiraceae bacterium]|nr:hypothetical protein [Oscillospiraceae bacterium]